MKLKYAGLFRRLTITAADRNFGTVLQQQQRLAVAGILTLDRIATDPMRTMHPDPVQTVKFRHRIRKPHQNGLGTVIGADNDIVVAAGNPVHCLAKRLRQSLQKRRFFLDLCGGVYQHLGKGDKAVNPAKNQNNSHMYAGSASSGG